MRTVKQFDVLSVAKMSGIVHGCLGLLLIPVFLMMGTIVIASGQRGAGFAFGGMAILLAVVAPFFYGFIGFLMGTVMAWLYNFAASRFGGIQVEIE